MPTKTRKRTRAANCADPDEVKSDREALAHISNNTPSNEKLDGPISKIPKAKKGRKKKLEIQSEPTPGIAVSPKDMAEIPSILENKQSSEASEMEKTFVIKRANGNDVQSSDSKNHHKLRKDANAVSQKHTAKDVPGIKFVQVDMENQPAVAHESNTESQRPSSVETGTLSDLEELRKANMKLREELEHKEHLLRNRNRRIEDIEKELTTTREREKREADASERQFQTLEKNYKMSMDRVRHLEMEVIQLQLKNNAGITQRGVATSTKAAVEVPKDYIAKNGEISKQLAILASEGLNQIKDVMDGLHKVKQVAEDLASVNKRVEENKTI